MTTPTNSVNETSLPDRAIQLERRYPGVRCKVEHVECSADGYSPARAQWVLSFYSASVERLESYGLATAAQFEREALAMHGKIRRREERNCFGDLVSVSYHGPNDEYWIVRTYVRDYHDGEKPFTKKLQADVSRMLKRFAKPKAPAAMRDLERRAAQAPCDYLKPQA